MKNVCLASIWLLGLAISQSASAQSASGTYRFMLEDEVVRYLDFNAERETGQMTFLDPQPVPDVDDPENPEQGEAPKELYIKAELDTLTVEKNQALMSGTIVDSSHRTYIGKWVQLVVEDNGTNPEVPDRLTWSFCPPRPGGWVPSDAELKYDDGAYLRWWATDAERKDDVGIPSVDLLARDEGCQVHPLWLYPFAEVLKPEGDIVVKP
jgi:hypothetical protein